MTNIGDKRIIKTTTAGSLSVEKIDTEVYNALTSGASFGSINGWQCSGAGFVSGIVAETPRFKMGISTNYTSTIDGGYYNLGPTGVEIGPDLVVNSIHANYISGNYYSGISQDHFTTNVYITGILNITGLSATGLDLSGKVIDRLNTAGIVSDTAYAASWDTVTTIAPSKNAVYDIVEILKTYLMVGSANSAFIPCDFQAGSNYRTDGVNILQTGGHMSNLWRLLMPTNRGALHLYLASARIHIADADAGDYVSLFEIYGHSSDGTVTQLVTDGTDQTTTGQKSYAFADVDVSGYVGITIYIYCNRTNDDDLDISNVDVECYYA